MSGDYTSPSDGNAVQAEEARKGVGPNRTTNAVIFFVRVLTAPLPFKAEDADLILKQGWVPPPQDPRPPSQSPGPAPDPLAWGSWRTSAGGSNRTRAEPPPRIMFRGRIIRSNNGLRPHILIRDPCRIANSRRTNIALIYKLLQKHTLFISKQSYFGDTPKVGDIVQVSLQRSRDFKGPDLQVSHFDEIIDSSQSEIYNFQNLRDCESLKEKMENEDPDFSASSFSNRSDSSVASSGEPVRPIKPPSQSHINNGVKFINKLSGTAYFKDSSIPFLAGLAANAAVESSFKHTAAGDPVWNYPDIYQERHPGLLRNALIPAGKTKKYCSFGYWQLNICSGAGVKFAEQWFTIGEELWPYEDFNNDGIIDDQDLNHPTKKQHYKAGKMYKVIEGAGINNFRLLAKLQNENNQFDYVSGRLHNIFGKNATEDANDRHALTWGRDIAVDFENCKHCKPVGHKDKNGDGYWASTYERGELAREIYDAYIIKHGP